MSDTGRTIFASGPAAPANGPDFITTTVGAISVAAQEREFLVWDEFPGGDDGTGNPPSWYTGGGTSVEFSERGVYAVNLAVNADSQDISLVCTIITGQSEAITYLPLPVGPVHDPDGNVGPYGTSACFTVAMLDPEPSAGLFFLTAFNSHASAGKFVSVAAAINRLIAFG